MKRFFAVFIVLVFVLALAGCASGADSAEYKWNYDNVEYTVNKRECTITDGDITISYKVNGSQITIEYPDGSSYYWTKSGNMGHGGWSDDYDADKYIPGDEIIDRISVGSSQKRERSGNPLVGLVLILVGAFNAAFPQAAWQLEYGWRFKDAEPSDMALGVNRVLGGIAVIAGMILMIV